MALGRLAGLALAALGTIAAASPSAIDLGNPRLFPESVTSTPDGTFYVGSVAGGVLRVRGGKVERWVNVGAAGTRSVFGVLADPRNKMLWLCSNDLSAMGITSPGEGPGSWLKGFDLATGALKVSARLPGERTWCNDIAVAKDGTVFVTNTQAPDILRLSIASQTLERWATDPRFQATPGPGLDGIAFGSDGDLYVTTLRGGGNALYRIAVTNGAAGAITKLETSRPLADPDGLRPIGGTVFALAEGGGSIDRVTVKGDRAEIETLQDGIVTPTGVTVVGRTAWYVQGQLSYLFDPTKRSQTPSVPFRLSPVPLTK